MDLNTFIVSVFCMVDDRLKDREPLRRRGPAPKLKDSEVLTIEVVGEFLGIDMNSISARSSLRLSLVSTLRPCGLRLSARLLPAVVGFQHASGLFKALAFSISASFSLG